MKYNSSCPNCRGSLTPETLMRDQELCRSIEGSLFNCQCGAAIRYSLVNRHSETCQAFKVDTRAAVVKPKTKVVNRWTYECPICHLKNLDRAALVEHFQGNHRGTSGVCPICTKMPWGDPNYVSADLCGHLKMRHKMDYEELTDYSMNDDEILRKVLEDSMRNY